MFRDFFKVVFSIFISTSDAFQSYHYPYSSRYGVPSRPVVFKPLDDLNIPEQGPIAIIPEEARRVPSLISSSYGVPSKPPVFKPIEDLNLPDQGPAIVAPNLNSIRQVPISSSSYGAPKDAAVCCRSLELCSSMISSACLASSEIERLLIHDHLLCVSYM